MILLLCSFILALFPLIAKCFSEINPQDTLLKFYSQELVAHGAMIFASTAATFRFITHFIKEGENDAYMLSRRSIIFTISAAFLLGVVIFLGFRLIYWGEMANITVYKNPIENQSLGEYTLSVNNEMILRVSNVSNIENFHWNLVKSCSRGFLDTRPFSIFPVSFYLGFFISFLLSWGFRSKDTEKPISRSRTILWAAFFIVPAILGIYGVSQFWSKTLSYWLIIVPIIYYILIPAIVYIYQRFR